MDLFAVAALFADVFTTEQLVASAMVGVGGVVAYNSVLMIRPSRKLRAEINQPTTDLDDDTGPGKKADPKKEVDATPLRAGVALLVIGIVMLIGGLIWRIDAER
jgi:hypothetical protein